MSPASFRFDSGTIYLEDFVFSCALEFAIEHNSPWSLKGGTNFQVFLSYKSIIKFNHRRHRVERQEQILST